MRAGNGRLNDILTESSEKERSKKMQAFALETEIAAHMFAQE